MFLFEVQSQKAVDVISNLKVKRYVIFKKMCKEKNSITFEICNRNKQETLTVCENMRRPTSVGWMLAHRLRR